MARKPKPKSGALKSSNPSGKPKAGHGGARPGSGRKPKAITVAKNELREIMADSADFAFKLFDKTMRNPKIAIPIRLECATEVLNRAWGKPRQSVEMKTTGSYRINLSDADDNDSAHEADGTTT